MSEIYFIVISIGISCLIKIMSGYSSLLPLSRLVPIRGRALFIRALFYRLFDPWYPYMATSVADIDFKFNFHF